MTCEEAETALVLGGSPAATAHRAGCARCAAAAGRASALRRCLAAYQVGEPPPGHRERTLAAAAALLAARAARLRGPRRRLVGALTVVLALLPLVIAANAQLVRTAHAVLSGFLPGYLTSYLVGSLALFLAHAARARLRRRAAAGRPTETPLAGGDPCLTPSPPNDAPTAPRRSGRRPSSAATAAAASTPARRPPAPGSARAGAARSPGSAPAWPRSSTSR